MDLYRHMTIAPAAGSIRGSRNSRASRPSDWVYGPNHPDATGPITGAACAERHDPGRGMSREFVSAGIAIDEWVPAKTPERRVACGWIACRSEGEPRVFLAMWSTDRRRR